MNQEKVFTGAACYVRVSTESQLENYSIEEQTKRIEAHCVSKGWGIYRIYTDPGYSGGNTDRPALKEMINDIKNNRIDVVIVYKLDRLSRSQKDTLTLIEDVFKKNNVDFVSVHETFDTSSPYGQIMIGLLSGFAQLEKEQIKERFTMGRIGRGKAGHYHGGPTAPTGYDYIRGTENEKGKLIVNEYKASQVREVYDRFLSGYSINSIQRYMHDKYGGWTSHALVINVLRNVHYIGKVIFKGIIYDGLQAPVIDADTFEKAQMLLKSEQRENNKTSSQKTPFRASYLLSSLVYCNKCGARYSGNHGYYKCYSRAKSDKKYIVDPGCKNKNWDIEKLDSLIIEQTGQLKHGNKYIESLFNIKKEEPDIDVKVLKDRIKAIDNERGRLIKLYQIGNMPIDEIKSNVDELEREKNNINKILYSPIKDLKETKANFVSKLNKFDNIFKRESLEEQRMYVSSLIESIGIDGEEIIINWRI